MGRIFSSVGVGEGRNSPRSSELNYYKFLKCKKEKYIIFVKGDDKDNLLK